LFVAALLSGRGFVLLRAHPEKRATLAAYAISGITAYAIVEMNAGAAFRRRIQFVPIVLLLAVVALTSVSFRQRLDQLFQEATNSLETESTTTIRRDWLHTTERSCIEHLAPPLRTAALRRGFRQ